MTRKTTSTMISGRERIWLTAPAAVYALGALAFVFWGGFVGDEGYYAWMARSVLNGLKPYQDFLCPQMPLMVYGYASWFQLVGAGIVEGRLLSAILGAASVLLVCFTVHRRVGLLPAVVGGLLLAGCLHFVYDTVVIKTQSLTVFLSACLLFVLANEESRRPVVRVCLAMVFGTLLFFTRLTFLPVLLLLWMLLGWQMRARPGLFVGLLVLNVLAVAAGYFWFSADGNMSFGIYRVHAEYFSGGDWSFMRLGWTIKTWIGNQLAIILFFATAGVLFVLSAATKLRSLLKERDFPFLSFMLLSYGSYTFLHWQSTQSYATHQTCVTTFAVVFSMIVVAPFLEKFVKATPVFCGIVFGCLLVLPLPFGEWSVHFNGNGSIGKIREAVALIRNHSKPDDSVLTLGPELAVESGRKLPVVCGLGEFSYLPALPDALAEKCHVMNEGELDRQIESGQNRILCLTNRELAIMARGDQGRAERLKEQIDRKYQLVGSVKNYGQFDQELFVFQVRD